MYRVMMGSCLLMAGCAAPPLGAPPSYEVRLDPTLTTDQNDLVHDAYQSWKVEAGANYTEVVSSQECAPVSNPTVACVHVSYGTLEQVNAVCGAEEAGHTHVGCTLTKKIGGQVWAANILLTSTGDYTMDHAIALHEAGHSMGLAHPTHADGSPIKGELMTANREDGYPDITELDVLQFKQVHSFQ